MPQSESRTRLLELPPELLITLPTYLHDIEDLNNLSSACRTLRDACSKASPLTILRLSAVASRTFFRPSPAFLVAACAKQLSHWMQKSQENISTFKQSCQEGMPGVLQLCLGQANCGITMARVRALYEYRMTTVSPTTDLIDKCIGAQWYATPNFWNGGVDDAWTIHSDPPESFFHLAIYGELFGDAISTYLATGAVPAYAQPHVRFEFLKYCVPDWACEACFRGDWNELRCTLKTGPYAEGYEKSEREHEFGDWKKHTHMLSLGHLVRSSRFNRAWAAVCRQLVDAGEEVQESGVMAAWSKEQLYDEEEEVTKQVYLSSLWRACFRYAGFAGMEQLARCGLGEYGSEVGEMDVDFKERLMEQWQRIMEMVAQPLQLQSMSVRVAGRSTFMWPDLLGDLRILTSGYT